MSCNFIGYCDSDGKLNNKGKYGYRWSASPKDKNNAQNFKFNKDKGKLNRNNRNNALPVRPVLKHSYRLIFTVSFYMITENVR